MATRGGSLPLLPASSLGSSACELSRWKWSRVCGIGGGMRHGGMWSGPLRRGINDNGSVRVVRGKDDVVVDDVAEEKETEKNEDGEPLLLRMGVSLVTEILRLLPNSRSLQEGELSRTAVVENQDVLEALREDYERAYFLTGNFTPSLYADDCLFADPTIQFRGRDKYQRNLKLLVPFFEEPKLTLFDIQEEDLKFGQERSINADWNLRTYLRLPWMPLIDVDGSTLYVMDANSKIVKHIESWSISGRQAVQQLFVPSDRAFFRKKS